MTNRSCQTRLELLSHEKHPKNPQPNAIFHRRCGYNLLDSDRKLASTQGIRRQTRPFSVECNKSGNSPLPCRSQPFFFVIMSYKSYSKTGMTVNLTEDLLSSLNGQAELAMPGMDKRSTQLTDIEAENDEDAAEIAASDAFKEFPSAH